MACLERDQQAGEAGQQAGAASADRRPATTSRQADQQAGGNHRRVGDDFVDYSSLSQITREAGRGHRPAITSRPADHRPAARRPAWSRLEYSNPTGSRDGAQSQAFTPFSEAYLFWILFRLCWIRPVNAVPSAVWRDERNASPSTRTTNDTQRSHHCLRRILSVLDPTSQRSPLSSRSEGCCYGQRQGPSHPPEASASLGPPAASPTSVAVPSPWSRGDSDVADPNRKCLEAQGPAARAVAATPPASAPGSCPGGGLAIG